MDCYKGNPFIESLPPMLDKNSFFLKIAEKPVLRFTDNLLDNLAQVNQIRSNFFVPFTHHFFLYAKLFNLKREVYRVRTPVDWIAKLNEIKRWSNDRTRLPQEIQHPKYVRKLMLGFSFLGVPGMGKTTSLDKIFSLFDQVIQHPDLGITQVPHLSIECTVKGSTKQLCRSFFDELDRVTGENFSTKYGRDSEEKLMIQMANKILLMQIAVLRIEEIHNICASSPSSRQVIINFFKTLANRIGIPIIYVGTKDAAPILYGNYQSASRGEGIGMEPLVPFKEDDTEWKFFIDKLWSCQIFPNPGQIPDDIRKAYYEKSTGILRQVINVHCNAQEIALYNGCTSLTVEHIRSTSAALPATSMAIAGYRNKNREILRHFDDLQMTSAYVFREDEVDSGSSSKVEKETKNLFDFAKKQWPKISYAQLDEIIASILEAYAELPIEEKFEKLTEGIQNLDRQDKIEKQPKLGDPKGELIKMCVNCNTSQDYYSILVQNGIIPELGEVASI